mmetsp:Transcript_1026/g.1014  ORF Transcript_1026/g.1014 Transcript_1026/m.1014 type:complete len:135 (+) Transcript_1026:730-1134(+)
MATMSKYEPPMEVEEKDSVFLHLERDSSHIVLCSQKYLQKRAMLIINEYEQNNKYSKLSGQVVKKFLPHSTKSSLLPKAQEERKVEFKLPQIKTGVKKNILTVKGKTYKKNDILSFKKYFDTIDEECTGHLTLD